MSNFDYISLVWVWNMAIIWGISPHFHLPNVPLAIAWGSLLLGIAFLGVQLYCALLNSPQPAPTLRSTAGLVLFYPFYFILHSVASIHALYDLCVRPHYWNKTTHGGHGTQNGQGEK